MNPFMSPKLFILRIVAASIVVSCLTQSASAQHPDDYYRGMARGLELFGEVYREIAESYAGQIDPATLAERAIQGMLASLDRHSAYLPPEAGDAATRRSLRVGIGIEVDTLDGALTVTEVLHGYSAHLGGVRVGDRILSVDGRNLSAGPPEALYEALRGEIGSTLHLAVAREGVEDERAFTLTRQRIRVPSIRYAGIIDGDVLFVRIERFGENAGNEFRAELLRFLRSEPAAGTVRGIVVDLRGNTGGILSEAVRVAEAFVPKGKAIVATEGRDTAEHEMWVSERDPVGPDVPLVLLVDGKSASASELLAAAIQDHDLGVIVGEPTVGKGVVQSVHGLPFGASIRLTTAWYVTPSGRSIQRIDELPPATSLRIIPDSLFGTFLTAGGRPVESGAGIVPDTILSPWPGDGIIPRLERIDAFFHFASLYTASLDSLPANFRLTGQTLLAFEEYALGRLLEHEEREGAIGLLDSLQESLSGTKNEKRIERLFDELSRAIIAGDEAQFADAREEIRRRLEEEIAARFMSREDRIAAGIATDPQVRLAVALVRDRAAYRRLLGDAHR